MVTPDNQFNADVRLFLIWMIYWGDAMTVSQDSINQTVELLQSHVHSSSLINGIKALHLSQECVDSYDNWDLIVSNLTSKGYDVRDSKFKSGNRLGHGEYVGVEISFKPPMEDM